MEGNRQKPSAGFWLLCGVSALVVAFFIWGFSTPRLEDVWKLEVKLKIGQIQRISDSEKEMFYGVFEDYPKYMKDLSGRRGIDLLSANSDGLSLVDELLILRTSDASNCGKFMLDVSGAQSEYPIVFTIKGRTWKKELKVTRNGRSTVWLPKGVQVPEFIEVTRKNSKGKSGSVDVKVRFCD